MALIVADAALAPTNDRASYTVTLVASFIVVLAIALVAQLLMLKWRRWFPDAENEKSLISGVRAAVSSFMPLL